MTEAEEGTLFTDDAFPAINASIAPSENWTDDYGSYEWIRASKIPSLTDDDGDILVFADDPTPSDINQGALGDCYFLSALSVLAEKPDRIRNMFEEQGAPNDFGIYGVKMFKNGVSRTVVLDDYIVCKNA
jgi:calpain-15